MDKNQTLRTSDTLRTKLLEGNHINIIDEDIMIPGWKEVN